MDAADDGPRLAPVPRDGGTALVEPCAQLEIDMQADARRLLDEERERLVERRQLRSHLTECRERHAAHVPGRGTVTHLVEMIGVSEHEWATTKVEHVELDQVDPHLDRRPERADRVLGGERGGTAVPDAEHPTAGRTAELDHEALRGSGPILRSHHQAASPTTIAWTTTIAAASFAVSCQKT